MGGLFSSEEEVSQDKHWSFRNGQKPLILGHRGVPHKHQENTMAGFQAAVDLGIDGIEFDVYVTKDNVPVVFHDEDTLRLTGQSGCIADMSYDEVSKLRIMETIDISNGNGKFKTYDSEQRIPKLKDVLLEFKDKLKMNVELKAYSIIWSRRHWGAEVAKVIRECDCAASVVVTSFDFFMLRSLEMEYPEINSGFAYDDGIAAGLLNNAAEEWFSPNIADDKFVIGKEHQQKFNPTDSPSFVRWLMEENFVGRLVNSSVTDLEWTVIDANTVQKFHEKNHAVGCYVFFPMDTSEVIYDLNDKESKTLIERIVQTKVDWMETDDPERLQYIMNNIYSHSTQTKRPVTVDI